MTRAGRRRVKLEVNGGIHELEVDPETPLLYLLRNDLGLKSPKLGCGSEQCGACKVLVDGEAVPSCRLPVHQVEGLPIVTLEGLVAGGDLHPLQEAFLLEQAAQCGYCTSGMIITAQGLLNKMRYPTDDQIRQALSKNLCRCGVYDRVRRAIKLRIGRPEGKSYEVVSLTDEALEGGPVRGSSRELPWSLQKEPALDAWVRIDEAETVTFFSGKVELGQGLRTALAQIGAEELDLSLERVRVVMADTAQTADEGLTVGSMSLETSGQALRWAAAAARQELLAIAYEELEAPLEQLVVEDGIIRDPVSGRSTSYWQLLGGRRFGVQITGAAQPKAAEKQTVIGRPAPRTDLPAKVKGEAVFVHDLDLPGMVHGRIIRPPHAKARLLSVDSDEVRQLPGVLQVVQDGSFLGVVAEREEQAMAAADALRASARWQGEAGLPPVSRLYGELFSQPDEPYLVVDGATVNSPLPAAAQPPANSRTFNASYRRPYQMHGSLGPSAAAALWQDGQLTLWVHTQGVFPQRAGLAHVLALPEEQIRVQHVEGAGCYGHNGADDAALDAALLARALPDRPVLLKWTREEEHGWEPYAPAMQIDLQASLDETGAVVDWQQDVRSPSHFGRPRSAPGVAGLLAAWHLAEPFDRPPSRPGLGNHSGSHRNADPLYTFARRVVKRYLPESPLRASSLRGLGAFANVFAIESFMDELAHASGQDPVAFRLRHLKDKRARAVIRAAAEKAGWQAGQQRLGEGRGRGMAFAQYKNRQSYAAVVVELQVEAGSGEALLQRVVIAADAGQIINPDGLSNQLEGGFLYAASQALYEEVTWDERGITSLDWDSYPILRFSNAPVIETVLLDRPGQPTVGAGEAVQGPTPAAIANAIFAASGWRLRNIPFAPIGRYGRGGARNDE